MAGTNSFDLVSDFDHQELVNAIDQTVRDMRTRYDLKDSKSEIKQEETRLVITADSEMHLSAIKEILQTKAIRRNLSIKIFDFGEPEEAAGATYRQIVTIRKGLPEDLARKISKTIRENFPKTQPQIQGDAIRIQSKSRDDLQAVIQYFRQHEEDYPVPLQFINMRSS